MSFPQGVYFYFSGATDPTDWWRDNTVGVYPKTSTQGNSVGWDTTAPNEADRNVESDVRLKGTAYDTNSTGARQYRIDLPSTGNYKVRVAMGDVIAHPCRVRIYDTSSLLLDVECGDSSANNFFDIAGTSLSGANWPGSNALSASLTFSTTICYFKFGNSTGTSDPNWVANAVYVEAASGAAAVFTKNIQTMNQANNRAATY